MNDVLRPIPCAVVAPVQQPQLSCIRITALLVPILLSSSRLQYVSLTSLKETNIQLLMVNSRTEYESSTIVLEIWITPLINTSLKIEAGAARVPSKAIWLCRCVNTICGCFSRACLWIRKGGCTTLWKMVLFARYFCGTFLFQKHKKKCFSRG